MLDFKILLNLLYLAPIITAIICYKLILRGFGVIIIPEDSIGIVNKKFVLIGKNKTLPDGAIIALNGEAGWQSDQLAPGIHFFLWPWQYEIKVEKMTTIPPGQIGFVNAKDGKSIDSGRILGKKVFCDTFQDARGFIEKGGERGQQMDIIPPGTYRIHTILFSIETCKITEVPSDKVGIVYIKDGLPLPKGEIAGKEIIGHNSFQDAQKFIDNGGFKGRQEQIIMAGRYFINPYFADIELVNLIDVPIAHVGVVISFVGEEREDVTGKEFQHANMVLKGKKGVWIDPFDPGRYAINPYTHKVICVPTQNVVLNWANDRSESHKLDANLCSIKVRSCDGFSFNLDVSQIIHIPRNYAPLVIAQFGSVENLVTQVLEPIIGNYFRNAAQGSDVITFLTERQTRQNEAKEKINNALSAYHVGAIDTLIGDITPPEELMKTLKDRQIATQQKQTFSIEREAEEARKELQQARAQADTQAKVVDAERKVQIADFDAQSAIKKANGDAASKTINAEADAKVLILTGDAEGKKITAIGESEAEVIRLKTIAVGQNNYSSIEIAKALSGSGFRLVPDIIAGGGNGNNSSLIDVLIGNILHEKIKTQTSVLKEDNEIGANNIT